VMTESRKPDRPTRFTHVPDGHAVLVARRFLHSSSNNQRYGPGVRDISKPTGQRAATSR
jgi:hypothetical protein